MYCEISPFSLSPNKVVESEVKRRQRRLYKLCKLRRAPPQTPQGKLTTLNQTPYSDNLGLCAPRPFRRLRRLINSDPNALSTNRTVPGPVLAKVGSGHLFHWRGRVSRQC